MNTHKSIVELVCSAIIYFAEYTGIKFSSYHVQQRISLDHGIEVNRKTINNYISKLHQARALIRTANPDNGDKSRFGHQALYVYNTNTTIVDKNSHAFLADCIRKMQVHAVGAHRMKTRKLPVTSKTEEAYKTEIGALEEALINKTKTMRALAKTMKALEQQFAKRGVIIKTQKAIISNQWSIIGDLKRNRSMSAEVLPAGTTDIAFKCVTRVINARLSLEISVDTPEYSHTIKKLEKI